MSHHSEYTDAKPKFGGAYTGWRPTEHRPLTWLSLIGWMLFLAACGWGLCQW